jgi:hypothetical protein
MFNNLRERIRTRQAYLDAPVTYEVLGVEADERDVNWFRRNFGHQSLRAMFCLYMGYGLVAGVVGALLAFDTAIHALAIGLVMAGLFAFNLLILRHESKKVT